MLQKNTLLFYLLFFASIINGQNNSLVIVSEFGKPFYLYINSDTVNKNAECIVKCFHLNNGPNNIEIHFFNANDRISFTDSILVTNNDKNNNKEFTYALIIEEQRAYLKFKSISNTSGPKKLYIPQAPEKREPIIDNNLYGNLYQSKNNKPLFFQNYDNAKGYCTIQLDDLDFSYAKALIEQCNDEETKFLYASKMIELNCYTSNQVASLLKYISSDLDKFDLSKKAYYHIIDKDNSMSLSLLFNNATIKTSYLAFLKDEDLKIKQKQLLCKEAVSDKSFNLLYEKVKAQDYEQNKLKLAKQLFSNTCLKSTQLKQLLNILIHDREKFDLLKSLYNLITDKENELTFTDIFQFEENKQEFLKFISKQK